MIDIQVDREADKPLYAQIRDALQRAIDEQNLQPGDQLPTVAAFAAQMGVTPGTVRRAYEDLTKSGTLACHVGRGTFVRVPCTDGGDHEAATTAAPRRDPAAVMDPEARVAARRLRMGIAKSLDNLLALKNRPGLIQFTAGVPSPSLARPGLLEALTVEALKDGQDVYARCSEPMGLPELRRALAERFQKSGLPVTADHILITNGSQQAVSLVAQSALEGGRRIICETPCYTGIPNAFSAYGHWVETVFRDLDGPILDRLNRFADGTPSMLYLCPELHNPMGTDLSPERRRALVDWAREQNAILVADEIFHDLRLDGPAPPSLIAELGEGQTILVGSVSKSFMGGLRVGWLISSPDRVRSIALLKRAMDLGCPTLMQGVVLSLLRSGEYDTHLANARDYYRVRREAALRALKRHMPDGVTWTTPRGGFNMWVELPAGYSSIALFLMAIDRGVAFIPGPYMDIDHRFVNAFRLSYSEVDVAQIQEGIELLADAVRELLQSPHNDLGLSGLGDFL